MKHVQKFGRLLALTGCMISVSACSIFSDEEDMVENSVPTTIEDRTATLGFNGYLWRAALDTSSKFPIAQIDTNSGIINSEWMTDGNAPNERTRVTIYILDKALRADAVRIEVFRQELKEGNWVNAPVQASTALRLEEALLERARELRIRSIEK